MSEINERTGKEILETHIHKFIIELATQNSNQVSFLELKKLFNSYYNIRDDDELLYVP